MIHVKFEDQILHDCVFAREMRQILNKDNYGPVGLAIGVDLSRMKAHYHKTFDEIYYVLEGTLDFEFYDPAEDKSWGEELSEGDTLVVPKGIHHKIVKTSPSNKLMITSIPPWHADDENPSDVL